MAICTDRRRFLTFSLAAAAAALGSPAAGRAHGGERAIALYNAHTGESLKAVYWAEGRYVAETLGEIDVLLRDYRTEDIMPIDPGLIDLLHRLRRRLRTQRAFHVVSGYRSPKTNALLRKNGTGVALRSLHMRGMAVDLFLPGRNLEAIRRAALSLRGGGVGYYPTPGFVHIDTGGVRSW